MGIGDRSTIVRARTGAPLLGALIMIAVLPGCCRETAPSAGEARGHLEHLLFIVHESRSFDHYYGTCPGADGIPMRNGVSSVCVPDPVLGRSLMLPQHPAPGAASIPGT